LSDGPHQATLQAFFLISSKKSSLLGNICKEGASPDTRLPSKKNNIFAKRTAKHSIPVRKLFFRQS
jgi:hypothetical protein